MTKLNSCLKRALTLGTLTSLLVGAAGTDADARGRDRSFKVTITNLTRGQVFSPSLVATHGRSAAPLFQFGQAASTELAGLAQDGAVGPLVTAWAGAPGVDDAQTAIGANGPIFPGESVSIVVSASDASRITVAGMLGSTNDAFYAISGKLLPKGKQAQYVAVAYDAGSEANTESCAHIPGPPCGSAFASPDEPAEGYVHVHAGVGGIADLSPDHDWRNPVALISIERQ